MKYLIDSDRVIDYLAGSREALSTLTELRSDGLALSLITFMEVYEGAFNSRDPQRAENVFRLFLEDVTLLPIDQDVALAAARIRAQLRQQRRQINHRSLDLLIAATAITHGLILVTRNRKDYEDIPNLVLFDAK